MLRFGFAVLALIVTSPLRAAATALPDPPFVNGGFVSPSATVFVQQRAIVKLIDKYVAASGKCDRSALLALHRAYADGTPETIQAARDKWVDCGVRIFYKLYVGAVDKIVAAGTPGCLDVAGIQNILDGSNFVRRYVRDAAYCDGDAANPDPTVQMNVPDTASEVLAEIKLNAPAQKAGRAVGRCYQKAAIAAFKNGGTLAQADLDRLSACETKAITKGQAAVQKVADLFSLPPCASVATLQTHISGAPSTATGIASLVYCAE